MEIQYDLAMSMRQGKGFPVLMFFFFGCRARTWLRDTANGAFGFFLDFSLCH
jgi:hypothetical protein